MIVTLDHPGSKSLRRRTHLVGKQVREEIQGIRKVCRELSADPVERRKFLQDAGILGKDGKLAKKYR